MNAALAGQSGPRNVAVFRALNLGDMLCSIPALRALRCHLPRARITLVGLESARPVLERFPQYLDELVIFPGDPAFPEQRVRHDDLPGFYREMQESDFDLALQMHGSGQQSNEIVRALGARQWAGFVPVRSQARPGRLMPWPDTLPEVHRYLALLDYLGIPADDDTMELPVTAQDRLHADALAAVHGLDLSRAVFIHPGARLASRRWPLERFAQAGAALAMRGWQVAITGSDAEAALAAALKRDIGRDTVDLCGATSLGTLAALLQRARLLVCNDTGISHVAAGVGTHSVVVASGSDVARWAPLDRARHTVLAAYMPCRPCAHEYCPLDGHPCATAVNVDDVLAAADRYLGKEQP